MVRQWQELFYGKNYSHVNITAPDFKKIAEAYRLPGESVASEKAFQKHLSILSKKGPFILEASVKQEDNVFPMVPGGKTLGETITEV
jgi:acetolactate synthase-1/2/3 large subunit